MFLLTSRLQLNTWAKWDTFRVFLMSAYSLESHRLWDTDFTLMDISPWSRSEVTNDKQRCNAHLLIFFEQHSLYLDQERREFVAGCRKWGREVPDASSSLPHPGDTSLHRTGAAASCQCLKPFWFRCQDPTDSYMTTCFLLAAFK